MGNDIELHSTTVFSIFAKFLYVFGASLVVGLTFGLGTAVLLKVLKSNSAPQACPLLNSTSYLMRHRCINCRLQSEATELGWSW